MSELKLHKEREYRHFNIQVVSFKKQAMTNSTFTEKYTFLVGHSNSAYIRLQQMAKEYRNSDSAFAAARRWVDLFWDNLQKGVPADEL